MILHVVPRLSVALRTALRRLQLPAAVLFVLLAPHFLQSAYAQATIAPDAKTPNAAQDRGDAYSSGGKARRLLRRDGVIHVQMKGDGGAPTVKDWATREIQSKRGERHFKLVYDGADQTQLLNPAYHAGVLRELQETPGCLFVAPEFATEKGNSSVTLKREIIVAVRPGTDPAQHFRGRFEILRRQRGTDDQFIVASPAKVYSEYLQHVTQEDAHPNVRWAAPNYITQIIPHTAPNDPLYGNQWHLHNTGQGGGVAGADIQAEDAWGQSLMTDPTVVAVLDTGVELTHPDLKLAANALELNGSQGIDDDGNGYVDDVYGVRFLSDGQYLANGEPDLGDAGHGTEIAGVIAAKGNNAAGVVGVAYETASILPIGLGVTGATGWDLDAEGLVAAIYYAGGRTASGTIVPGWTGADALNLSWGYFADPTPIEAALDWVAAHGRAGRGCIIAAASGNNAARYIPVEMDVPAGAHNIDFVAALSAGAFYLDDVEMPGYVLQGFEGTQMPPPPWDGVSGWDPTFTAWTRSTGNPLLVASGNASARASVTGVLANPVQKTLRFKTPATFAGGVLRFKILAVGVEQNPSRDRGFYILIDNLARWPLNADGSFPNGPLGYPRATAPFVGEFGLGFPATHPGVMAVGASSEQDILSVYSQGGTELSLVAPVGELYWNYGMRRWGITTTTKNGGYSLSLGGLLGTSYAAPQVAAAAACLIANDPHRPAAEVKALLNAGTEKIGATDYIGTDDFGGVWNEDAGFGRLNLARSLELGGWSLLLTNIPGGLPWELSQSGSPTGRIKYLQKLGAFSISTNGYFSNFPNDSLLFARETYSGNATIIARVHEVSGGAAASSAGLMARGPIPSGTFAYVGLKAEGGIVFARRNGTGVAPVFTNALAGAKPPYWLRLVTTSTTVAASASANGTSWTSVGSVTMAGFTNPKSIGFTAVGGATASSAPVNQGALIDQISFTGPNIISTVAGSTAGYTSDGVASASKFGSPAGLSYAPISGYLVADAGNNRVRDLGEANPGSWVSLRAGDGIAGFSGDGGSATLARLNSPQDVCWDEFNGGYYIADTGNHCIRRVSQGGIISTIAGIGGSSGFSGDGGAAAGAQLSSPSAVAVDSGGRVYIADRGNHRIRMVDPLTGLITTVAGGGSVLGDAGPATAAKLVNPSDVVVDLHRNLYIADAGQFRIRRVDAAAGTIETVAGTGIAGYTGNGGQATVARIGTVNSLCVDLAGNLFIADVLNSSNHRVRKVTSRTGVISLVAGSGTAGFSGDNAVATAAQLNSPHGIVVDSGGRILVADKLNNRLRTIY